MKLLKNGFNSKKISSLAALAGIIIFYVILEGIGITCPILFLTGVSCAGCGMSRAWLSLLHGNVELAFSYHPLFWMPPLVLLAWIFRYKIPEGVLRMLCRGGCVLFFAVYILRMFNPADRIVIFDPVNGLMGRCLSEIYHFILLHESYPAVLKIAFLQG